MALYLFSFIPNLKYRVFKIYRISVKINHFLILECSFNTCDRTLTDSTRWLVHKLVVHKIVYQCIFIFI